MKALALIIALSGLILISASPSFRFLQDNSTVPPVNTTVPPVNTTVPPVVPPVLPNPYPGYTAINTSDPNASWYNSQVYSAFKHGVNALVQTAIFQGKAPLALYNVTNWSGAWYRNVSSGVSYRFSCQLRNARGVGIRMNLTVNYRKSNGNDYLGAYNYYVTNIPRGSFPANGYRFLTPAQKTNNTIFQGALKSGAEWMIQWLVDRNKIPAQDVNYTMWGLPLAVYKSVKGGISYQFQTQNANAELVHVDTNLTVFYNTTDKSYNVTQYWYRGYNYSDSDLVNGTNITNSTTTNVTTVVNSTTIILGNETITITLNSTVVTGSADVTTINSNSTAVDNSTSTDNSTIPNPPTVSVDISYVTQYNDTTYQTPLVAFNPPAQPSAGNGTTLL